MGEAVARGLHSVHRKGAAAKSLLTVKPKQGKASRVCYITVMFVPLNRHVALYK